MIKKEKNMAADGKSVEAYCYKYTPPPIKFWDVVDNCGGNVFSIQKYRYSDKKSYHDYSYNYYKYQLFILPPDNTTTCYIRILPDTPETEKSYGLVNFLDSCLYEYSNRIEKLIKFLMYHAASELKIPLEDVLYIEDKKASTPYTEFYISNVLIYSARHYRCDRDNQVNFELFNGSRMQLYQCGPIWFSEISLTESEKSTTLNEDYAFIIQNKKSDDYYIRKILKLAISHMYIVKSQLNDLYHAEKPEKLFRFVSET